MNSETKIAVPSQTSGRNNPNKNNKLNNGEREFVELLVTLASEVLEHSGETGRVTVGSGITVSLETLGEPLARLPSGCEEYFQARVRVHVRKRLVFQARTQITEHGSDLLTFQIKPGPWIEELIKYVGETPPKRGISKAQKRAPSSRRSPPSRGGRQ